MTQDGPLLAVQEALKKCFPVVEEQQGRWRSTLRACPPLLASLGNLAEQLQAAQNLRFEDVPALRAFPGLKERLRRKQLEAGDTSWTSWESGCKRGGSLALWAGRCSNRVFHKSRGSVRKVFSSLLESMAFGGATALPSLHLLQGPLSEYHLLAFPWSEARLAQAENRLLRMGHEVSIALAALLKVRDTVSSHVGQVLQVYEQHADVIGMDAVLQASAVSPSVADMLEWLQDIERHYRRRYLKRKYLLSSIHWGDLASIQALPTAWDRISEDEHQDLVPDILLNVSFFLEE
ncbi:hypothetical protein QTO34_018753 [Cnephaeus nilssonii]|uniref:Uncharacterized protein n=1 Tax=Cnephaeus nilssonii TaxID=3371016 RepID=A0AA40HZD5_CNENI|nr:hypothetical protein QTO34_018753 [Eptesicus nilssonii]